MNNKITFVLLSCIVSHMYDLHCITINQTPLHILLTPHSILDHKENYKPLFIGNRKRYATCTGVAWFHDNFLATLNLYGAKINTYRYCANANQFTHFQEITNAEGAQLTYSENLAVSPDGTLLAVCSDSPNPGVKIYTINKESHFIDPKPIINHTVQELVHNVRFTHDGRYVATVGWNKKTAVCIYKINKTLEKMNLELVFSLPNDYDLLVPKGINFTKDGKFALIAFSPQAGSGPGQLPCGNLHIYKFNADTGLIDQLICKYPEDKNVLNIFSEDILLVDNDRTVILTDQSNDRLILIPFNPITGQLRENIINFMGPKTRLSFPHGISLKSDENMLAVSNYGSDTVTVYEIKGTTQPQQNHVA